MSRVPSMVNSVLRRDLKDLTDLHVRIFAAMGLKKGSMSEEIDCFTKIERQVINARFGLEDGVKRSPDEVARMLGLTLQKVREYTRTASRKLPIRASEGPVTVLHQDSEIIVVNKPPDVRSQPVHRFKGDSVLQRLVRVLGYAPCLVHRLDMHTSGILVFALNPKAAQIIIKQFTERTVRKKYLLIAEGVPNKEDYSVEVGIGLHPSVVHKRAPDPRGQPAFTSFTLLSSQSRDRWLNHTAQRSSNPIEAKDFPPAGASLLLAAPRTGRRHQIRIHAQHSGHPILGDDLYGRVGPCAPRLALHAYEITFEHPSGTGPMTLRAPLPDDLVAACRNLGLGVERVQHEE